MPLFFANSLNSFLNMCLLLTLSCTKFDDVVIDLAFLYYLTNFFFECVFAFNIVLHKI